MISMRNTLRNQSTTSALRTELRKLETALESGRSEVAKFKAAGQSVEPGKRDAFVDKIVICRKEWRKRKRITSDFLGMQDLPLDPAY